MAAGQDEGESAVKGRRSRWVTDVCTHPLLSFSLSSLNFSFLLPLAPLDFLSSPFLPSNLHFPLTSSFISLDFWFRSSVFAKLFLQRNPHASADSRTRIHTYTPVHTHTGQRPHIEVMIYGADLAASKPI